MARMRVDAFFARPDNKDVKCSTAFLNSLFAKRPRKKTIQGSRNYIVRQHVNDGEKIVRIINLKADREKSVRTHNHRKKIGDQSSSIRVLQKKL